MTFLLKITFYALFALSSIAGGFYLIASLLGLLQNISSAKTREDMMMIVACIVTLGILYKAYQTGHVQEHWGPAVGLVLGAIVAFIVIYLGGMLLFGKIHWQ